MKKIYITRNTSIDKNGRKTPHFNLEIGDEYNGYQNLTRNDLIATYINIRRYFHDVEHMDIEEEIKKAALTTLK